MVLRDPDRQPDPEGIPHHLADDFGFDCSSVAYDIQEKMKELTFVMLNSCNGDPQKIAALNNALADNLSEFCENPLAPSQWHEGARRWFLNFASLGHMMIQMNVRTLLAATATATESSDDESE